MSFTLDARLDADTTPLGDLPLCRALLMDDARFPWLILAPRRAGVAEVDDLSPDDQAQLMREIATATGVMRSFEGVEKVNVGALGNIVRQLHVHIVGRKREDAVWPGPVWGAGHRLSYEAAERDARRAWFAARLKIAPP